MYLHAISTKAEKPCNSLGMFRARCIYLAGESQEHLNLSSVLK